MKIIVHYSQLITSLSCDKISNYRRTVLPFYWLHFFLYAHLKCNKKSSVNFDILGVGDLEFEGVVGGSGDQEQPDSEVDCWDRVYNEALKHTNAGGTMEL